jgi:predicted nuclease of predicted toxin-antitoxin system
MKFLADMGIAMRIVEWLRQRGHDIIHLREEGLHNLPDREIFKKAISEGRIILTFDLDFGEIVALSGDLPVSVSLFRLRNTRTPYVIQRLEYVLNLNPASTDKI